LILRLKPVPRARAYEVRKMNGTGGWMPAGIGTKARRLEVEGLTPGSVYQFQVRAIGGSTNVGPWSDAVQHMAT
jgi:chitodextrinase